MSVSQNTLSQVGSVSTTSPWNWVYTAGRVVYALPFAVFGLFHFMNASQMAGMVPAWIPGGQVLWVYLTGVALLAAAGSFIVNRQVKAAGIALAVLLLSFVLFVHAPGLANEATAQMAMPNLLKDLALAGGALLLAGRAGTSS
jgi:uncharacterized membrane protein